MSCYIHALPYKIGDIVEGTMDEYTFGRIFAIGSSSYTDTYVMPLAEYRDKRINEILE
jgi:hypothetical protein